MTVNFALRDWIDWNFRTQNFAGDRQAVEALMALYPIQNDTTPLPPFSKYQKSPWVSGGAEAPLAHGTALPCAQGGRGEV